MSEIVRLNDAASYSYEIDSGKVTVEGYEGVLTFETANLLLDLAKRNLIESLRPPR